MVVSSSTFSFRFNQLYSKNNDIFFSLEIQFKLKRTFVFPSFKAQIVLGGGEGKLLYLSLSFCFKGPVAFILLTLNSLVMHPVFP